MFAMDVAAKPYLRRRAPRAGWGRILLLAALLLLASARLAYGSGPARLEDHVVEPGQTVWSIAAARYGGDPRPRVDEILRINHMTAPILVPGQTLRVPAG